MRLSRVARGLAALVCYGALSCVLAATPSGAGVFISHADVVIAAQRAAGAPLPVSDPRVQSLIASASAPAIFDGVAIPSNEESDVIGKVCGRNGDVLGAYLLDGTGVSNDAGVKPEHEARILANSRKYEAAVSPMLALSFACGGYIARTMASILPTTLPTDRVQVSLSISHFQQAVIRMYVRLLTMKPEDLQQSEAHRDQVVAAAGDAAPVVAVGLTVAQRKDLYERVVRTSALAPHSQSASFEKMKHAFAKTACTGLCAYEH